MIKKNPLDDILEGVDLPSEEQIAKETASAVSSIRMNNMWQSGKMKGPDSEARKRAGTSLKRYHADNKHISDSRIQSMNAATRKPVITPYGEYVSKSEFYKETNIAFDRKHQSMPHLYYFKEDGPGEVTYETVCYSPYGSAPNTTHGWNRKALFEKVKLSGDPHAQIKGAGEWWRKMMRKDQDNYYEKNEPKREWNMNND